MSSALGPFETQRRSRWVQRMLVGTSSDFGHENMPWFRRSMLAIAELNLEGKEVTSKYLQEQLADLVGYAPHKSHLSMLVKKSVDEGLLRPTGRKICLGVHHRYPSYIVVGRAKVDRSTGKIVVEGTHG